MAINSAEKPERKPIVIEPTNENQIDLLNRIGALLTQYRANMLGKPQSYTGDDLKIAAEAGKKAWLNDAE